MTTTSISHHGRPYAAAAAAMVALMAAGAVVLSSSGSISLPGSDQPTLVQAPTYGAYPPGGQYPGFPHQPTTAGGRVQLGE